MALARLITRTPEFAQKLRQSLESAGYTVAFASPEDIPAAAADLEVNLDDPSSASSYLVTADGREISFGYDPIEREFVLAPLWRKFRAALDPTLHTLMERFRRPQPVATEPEPLPPTVAPMQADASPIEPVPEVPASPIAPLLATAEMAAAEAPVQSLYLPVPVEAEVAEEPLRFSGADYFDGLGIRRSGPEAEPSTLPSTEAPEPQPVRAPSPEAVAAPTPWLVRAALQADALRRQLAARLTAVRSTTTHKARQWREYDQAWLRAVPTAAVITLAFLLGWAAANSGATKSPVRPGSGPAVNEAAVIPAPASPAPVAVKTSTPKPAPQPRAVRVAREEDQEEAADVVIRHYPKHYPSKGVQAANQKSVRRYSDLN